MSTPEIKLRMLIETIQDKLDIPCVHYRADDDRDPWNCRVAECWAGCAGQIGRCEVTEENLKK